MPDPQFNPGFRISRLDLAVLVVGATAATLIGMSYSAWLAIGIVFVVMHFFLFCNVFRVSRLLELTWSALFIALAMLTVLVGVPSWPTTFAITVLGTFSVIAIEVRKPSYHGVGWKWANPNLPEWWESRKHTPGIGAPSDN